MPNELLEHVAHYVAGVAPRPPLAARTLRADGAPDAAAPCVAAPHDLLQLRRVNRRLSHVVDAAWPALVPEAVARRFVDRPASLDVTTLPQAQRLRTLLGRAQAVNVRLHDCGPSAKGAAGPSAADQAWRRLAYFTDVRHLWLEADVADGRGLLPTQLPASLTTLRLHLDLGEGIVPLARTALPPGLTRLDLSVYCLLQEDWWALLQALPASLTHLFVRQEPEVNSWDTWPSSPPLQLAACQLQVAELTLFHLSRRDLGDFLDAQTALRRLVLDVREPGVADADFLAAHLLASLRELELRSVPLTGRAGRTLLQRVLPTLTSLALDDSALCPTSVKAFADRDTQQLTALTLTNVEFARGSGRRLAQALPKNLTHVVFGLNHYEDPHELGALCAALPASVRALSLNEDAVTSQTLLTPTFTLPQQLQSLSFGLADNALGNFVRAVQASGDKLEELRLFAADLPDRADRAALGTLRPELRITVL